MASVTTGTIPTWTLADRLIKARESARLSQEALGDMIGLSRQTVSNYERDAVRQRPRALVQWARATGVDIGWLLGGDATSGCISVPTLRRFRLALDGDLAQLSLFGGAEPALPDRESVNRVLCSLPGNDRRHHRIPVPVDRRLAAA